jgi:putative copper export protein
LFVAETHFLNLAAFSTAMLRHQRPEDGAGAVLVTLAAVCTALVPLAPLGHGTIDGAWTRIARDCFHRVLAS